MSRYRIENYDGAMNQQQIETVTEEEKQQQTAPQRFCRKCFLREMMERGALEESYKSMLERIEMMDEDLRCMGEAYEARLSECKKCENLAEGMCRLCGCFVELRAAVKSNACPALPKHWEAFE